MRYSRAGKMNETKVLLLHRVYRRGMFLRPGPRSIRALAVEYWQSYGYKNPMSATSGIRRAFLRHGLPLRTRSQAAKVGWRNRQPALKPRKKKTREELIEEGLRFLESYGLPVSKPRWRRYQVEARLPSDATAMARFETWANFKHSVTEARK